MQLAGSVTAVFNCQGPLDAPIFVGSGMVSRKMSYSVSDVPVSPAMEAMLKSKEAGAVAAFDRVPFSYVSANFTFNTDNCVSAFFFFFFPSEKLIRCILKIESKWYCAILLFKMIKRELLCL